MQVEMHAYDALGKLGGTGTTIMMGDYSKLPNWLFPRVPGFQTAFTPLYLSPPSLGVTAPQAGTTLSRTNDNPYPSAEGRREGGDAQGTPARRAGADARVLGVVAARRADHGGGDRPGAGHPLRRERVRSGRVARRQGHRVRIGRVAGRDAARRGEGARHRSRRLQDWAADGHIYFHTNARERFQIWRMAPLGDLAPGPP
jgi:hypothetical protein